MAFALILFLIPEPNYSSLHSIKGVVNNSYNKTISSSKSSTRYKVVEINSGSSVHTVYVERFKKYKKINDNDEISVKVLPAPSRSDIFHVQELIVNGNPVITFEEFLEHNQRVYRTFTHMSLGLAIIFLLSGIYFRSKAQ